MNMVIDELEVNYDGFYKGYATGFVTIDNQQSYPFLYRIYSPKNGESWKLVSIENITDLSEDEFKSIESNKPTNKYEALFQARKPLDIKYLPYSTPNCCIIPTSKQRVEELLNIAV